MVDALGLGPNSVYRVWVQVPSEISQMYINTITGNRCI